MKELTSEIEIEAPPARVWQVLTDFPAFRQWNPFIREISGAARAGNRLRVRLGPPGGRAMTFEPRVLVSEENRELRWLGRVGLPGIFDGEHLFTLEPLAGNRTRFVQRELFRGLLVPLLAGSLDRGTRRGFEEMNRALKERVEGSRSSPPIDRSSSRAS